MLNKCKDKMIREYKEIRGTVVKKYRNLWGQYILVMDENGTKTKMKVGKMLFAKIELNTTWTMGHLNGKLINIRPGIQKI